MGREAVARAEYAGRSGEVRALLEGEGIVLRAPLSTRIPRGAITDLAVEGDDLRGRGPEGPFRLSLGAVEARKWKAALEKPPPTLADKLGLRGGVTVWTSGAVDTPELAAALRGLERAPAAEANLRLIAADSEDALARALDDSAGSTAPVWIVHGKGKAAALGEGAVRDAMRRLGYVDVKVSAVSADQSATRYVKR